MAKQQEKVEGKSNTQEKSIEKNDRTKTDGQKTTGKHYRKFWIQFGLGPTYREQPYIFGQSLQATADGYDYEYHVGDELILKDFLWQKTPKTNQPNYLLLLPVKLSSKWGDNWQPTFEI